MKHMMDDLGAEIAVAAGVHKIADYLPRLNAVSQLIDAGRPALGHRKHTRLHQSIQMKGGVGFIAGDGFGDAFGRVLNMRIVMEETD